jgi:hypothetical protein
MRTECVLWDLEIGNSFTESYKKEKSELVPRLILNPGIRGVYGHNL